MRFEVPQFVEVEDKIFGPLTWKQFLYIAGGCGAAFMLYVLLPFPIFLIAALPILGLAAGLAFYQVNNRPLSLLLESIFSYFSKARLYLWKKQGSKADPAEEAASTESADYKPPASGKSISTLAQKLEMNALDKK